MSNGQSGIKKNVTASISDGYGDGERRWVDRRLTCLRRFRGEVEITAGTIAHRENLRLLLSDDDAVALAHALLCEVPGDWTVVPAPQPRYYVKAEPEDPGKKPYNWSVIDRDRDTNVVEFWIGDHPDPEEAARIEADRLNAKEERQ